MRACGSGLWRDRGFAGDSEWAPVVVTEAEVSEQGRSLPPPAEFLTPGSTTAAATAAASAAAAAAFRRSLRVPRRESAFRRTARISSITARLMGKF